MKASQTDGTVHGNVEEESTPGERTRRNSGAPGAPQGERAPALRRPQGSLLARGWRKVLETLERAESWAIDQKKALYGFAVLRIVAGISMFGFLAVNFSTRYYTYGSGSAWMAESVAPGSAFSTMPVFGIVHLVAFDDLWFTVVYLALMALSVCLILGYRFRIVLPPAFVLWVGLVEQSSLIGDTSDHLSRIVLLFLFFADPVAVWSMDARRRRRWRGRDVRNVLLRLWRGLPVLPSWLSNLAHNAVLVIFVSQICLVYFAGGFYKLEGSQWRDGTAVWYPMQVDMFSAFPEIASFLLDWGPLTAAVSLGTVLVQIWFPVLLLRRWTRVLALIVVMAFHVAIAVFMALPWFSLWMVAIDAVLISDASYRRVAGEVRKRWPWRGKGVKGGRASGSRSAASEKASVSSGATVPAALPADVEVLTPQPFPAPTR